VILTCPHCGLDALPAWRKLALGPIATVSCRRCGLKVSAAVPQALVAFVPSLVAVVLVLSGLWHRPATLVTVGAVGWLLTCVLYLLWVPLVPRQVTRQEAVVAARAAQRGDGGGVR
jgi:hypothetical protein